MVQAPTGARIQRLGDLPDDGANLRGIQPLADQRRQGAAVGGLGDDEGRVMRLDVENPLDPPILDKDCTTGRFQDLGTMRGGVGEHEDRHRAIQDRISSNMPDYSWECCGQGSGQSVAPCADRRCVGHDAPSSRAKESQCMWSECTGRECPYGGCLSGQIRKRGGWRRNSRRWGWCRSWCVHGAQHRSVCRRV